MNINDFNLIEFNEFNEAFIDELKCPNCYRIRPNKEFKRGKGCPWCIGKKK